MVSTIVFSWCFCFLLSRVSSCCCRRFPSLVRIGSGSESSSFDGGDCGFLGSRLDEGFWDGENCHGCLLVGWSIWISSS